MRRSSLSVFAAVFAVTISACAGAGGSDVPSTQVPSQSDGVRRHAVGLGPVVQSQFGGQIFGWDIDQNGNDGVLTETVLEQTGMVLNAVETFDETTGNIVKVVQKTLRANAAVEPVAEAIAGSDVGVIDVARDASGFKRNDKFEIMNPVSGNKITRTSSRPPGVAGFVTSYVSDNQSSPNQAVMGFYTDKQGNDVPALYTYDTASNQWGHRMTFPHGQLFNTSFPLYIAVDSKTNEAVTGYLIRSRYNPHESPSFDVLNAVNGKRVRGFYGVGYGFVNGMAIDSTTGIMCTTTTGDMDVEFYKLSTGKGKAVQIPTYFGGGGETNGAAVAVDPVHHLFLVAQLNSTFSNGGSTVIVYNEQGKLIEYINGFNFFSRYSVVVPRIAVNPAARIGYVNGPSLHELQEFTY